MLFHEELFTRSQCSCCQQEISQMGVECLDCENINLLLCCDCMGMGAEIGQHKADHRYRFFDSGSLVLSLKGSSQAKREGGSLSVQKRDLEDIKWTAREEIRLLDAIEQYGFGNWHDISKHIETKTPIEAKVEYVNRYVVGALGELTWSTDIPNDVTRNICSANQQKPVDHTLPSDDGPLSPSLTQRLPPLEVSPEDMLQLGYMPQRDDYEKEYDNEAEKLISQLSFLPDDEEYDVGAKLALVDIYSSRLRERARRKRMIRDFQLVAKFFRASKMKISTNPLSEWNGNKDTIMPRGRIAIFERTITDALRPFVQFYNNREFTNFVRNLARELEQKTRQNELFKYRINGIRRPDECIEYERAKGGFGQIRGKRRLDTIQESSPQGRSGSKKALLEKFAAPLLVRQLQLAVPQNSKSNFSASQSPTMTTTSNSEKEENAEGNHSVGQSLIPQLSFSEDFSSKSCMESKESEPALFPLALEEPKATELMEVLTQPANENSYLPKEKPKASVDQFTVDNVPSADLLTDDEFQFCLKISLTPAQYLTSKTALLLARKPKAESQRNVEIREIGCPQGIQPDEWKQLVCFFKSSYNNS